MKDPAQPRALATADLMAGEPARDRNEFDLSPRCRATDPDRRPRSCRSAAPRASAAWSARCPRRTSIRDMTAGPSPQGTTVGSRARARARWAPGGRSPCRAPRAVASARSIRAIRPCSNAGVLQLLTAHVTSASTNPASLPPIVSVTRSAPVRSALSSCVCRSCVCPAATCGTPPRLCGSTFFVFAPEHAHDAHPIPPDERTFLSEPYLFLPPRIPGCRLRTPSHRASSRHRGGSPTSNTRERRDRRRSRLARPRDRRRRGSRDTRPHRRRTNHPEPRI